MSKKHKKKIIVKAEEKKDVVEAKAQPQPKEEKQKDSSPKEQKLILGAFSACGLAAGAVSYFVDAAYALPIGIIILFVVTTALRKLTGKQKIGAWALSGIFVYLFLWLDAWVVLFNVF